MRLGPILLEFKFDMLNPDPDRNSRGFRAASSNQSLLTWQVAYLEIEITHISLPCAGFWGSSRATVKGLGKDRANRKSGNLKRPWHEIKNIPPRPICVDDITQKTHIRKIPSNPKSSTDRRVKCEGFSRWHESHVHQAPCEKKGCTSFSSARSMRCAYRWGTWALERVIDTTKGKKNCPCEHSPWLTWQQTIRRDGVSVHNMRFDTIKAGWTE